MTRSASSLRNATNLDELRRCVRIASALRRCAGLADAAFVTQVNRTTVLRRKSGFQAGGPIEMIQIKKRVNRIPAFTFHGCVVTKHRSKSCRAMCIPIHGVGACGRIAPHSMMSRIQQSIAAHKRELERRESDHTAQAF